MTMRTGLLLLTAAVVAYSAPALAQPTPDPEIQAIRDEIARLHRRLNELEATRSGTRGAAPVAPLSPVTSVRTAEAVGQEPPVQERAVAVPIATTDRALQPEGLQVQVTATTDSSTASVRLSRTLSDGDEDTASYSSFAVIASAPLSKSSGPTDIGTLDGFVNSARLRLQYSRFERTFVDPQGPEYDALVATVRSKCRANRGERCDRDIIDNNFVATHAPELETRFLELFRTRGDGQVDRSGFAYGLEGSIGYSNFRYVLPGPARREEGDRIPLSAKAFISWLPDVRRNAITLGAEYQRTFEDASSATLCPVVPGTTELTCLSGPLGEPVARERLIGSLEYRQIFFGNRNSIIPAWGFSTQISYDALNDDFAIDVPIYLAGDSAGRVNGGVRFGYTTNGDDLAVGVFVGTNFSLRRQ
jgi:hypothetical protein